MSDTKVVAIQPDATLEEVLTSYPRLEAVVSELIPTFGNLKPGMVRDSIARTTTLEQAASTAQLRLPDFINKLRKAAGLPEDSKSSRLPGMPLWVSEGVVKKTLDARSMLAQGQHPKQLVLDEVAGLQFGEVFVLVTPFVPGPLIELARAQGSQTWTKQAESGKVETYFSQSQ